MDVKKSGPRLAPSLWTDLLGDVGPPRPALRGDVTADVCVVGAGFTGLWTAYYLSVLEPNLRVVVVDKHVAGFGASGRNGGWCSALFPAAGLKAQMRPSLAATVDEVGRIASAEGINCAFEKAGTLTLATTPAQATRLRVSASHGASHGGGGEGGGEGGGDAGEGGGWLGPDEAAAIVRVSGALGGVLDPDCAALQPAALVRGLAEAAERRGVTVHEATPAHELNPGLVVTDRGSVRAPVVVRATEAYTATLPGRRRDLVPVYSLVLATEPLTDEAWAEIGWRRRVTLGDARHLIIYAQRTADGRIVLGGRGAPYHAGSRIRSAFDTDDRVFTHLAQTLVGMFPAAAGAKITHRWGGPLGVPRDWTPAVRFDRATGLASAGGYVGDGVAAAALAGRTLAELICDHDTERTRLPWVGRPVRRWEPEPLRWVGVNGARLLAAAADARENRTGRPSVLGQAVGRLTGH